MNVCAECFCEEEIRHFITSSGTDAKCDCCGKISKVVDLNEFSGFFVELLKLFVNDDGGISLIRMIQDRWKIFSSDNHAEKILSRIITDFHIDVSILDKVAYLPEIQSYFSSWERLKTAVKHERRYFTDFGLSNWGSFIVSNDTIKQGTVLYRARIIPEKYDNLDIADMGCPPKEQAKAGRANPLGIPYLYLCNAVETTFYEVRAVYLDKISVGEFIVLHDLNIVDFSNNIDLYYAYSVSESGEDLAEIVKKKILFDKISADLSNL